MARRDDALALNLPARLRDAARRTLLDRVVGALAPGRELARVEARLRRTMLGYRAANISRLRRRRSGPTGAADRHLTHAQISTLRENARELDRDNCIAAGLLNRMVDNIVGDGGRIEALTDDEDWNQRAEGLFAEWSEDPQAVDLTGRFTWAEMVSCALRAVFVDGDHLLLPVDDGRLQQVEGDQVRSPILKTKQPGTRIVHGVEIDATNRPVAYWIAPGARGMEHISRFARREADKAFWLWNWKRCSQTRGVSALADTDVYFEHLDRYIEFAIVASEVSSSHVIGVETEFGGALGAPEGEVELDESGEDQYVEETEAGTMLYLEPGEKLKPLDPTHPVPEFEPFVRAFSRFLGLPLGMPLELVLLDWSTPNFAASKGALQQAKKAWRKWQLYVRFHLQRPVYLWKVRQWMAEGRLSERPDWARAAWQGPGWDWIDVYREVVAAERSIAAGLDSRSRIAVGRGLDLEAVMRQRAREILTAQRIARERGIPDLWREILGEVGKGADRPTRKAGTQGDQ